MEALEKILRTKVQKSGTAPHCLIENPKTAALQAHAADHQKELLRIRSASGGALPLVPAEEDPETDLLLAQCELEIYSEDTDASGADLLHTESAALVAKGMELIRQSSEMLAQYEKSGRGAVYEDQDQDEADETPRGGVRLTRQVSGPSEFMS